MVSYTQSLQKSSILILQTPPPPPHVRQKCIAQTYSTFGQGYKIRAKNVPPPKKKKKKKKKNTEIVPYAYGVRDVLDGSTDSVHASLP